MGIHTETILRDQTTVKGPRCVGVAPSEGSGMEGRAGEGRGGQERGGEKEEGLVSAFSHLLFFFSL